MRMRKFGDKTQIDYVRAVRKFTQYLGRSPDTASVEDLRNYQLYLVDQGTSPYTLNSTISGLKFFFGVTLDQPELMAKMQPVPLPRKLPVILSPDEVKRLIVAAGNIKHQTVLALAYATGLRISEVVSLKVGAAARLFHGLAAVVCDLHLQAGPGKQFRSHFLVDQVVLGQQDELKNQRGWGGGFTTHDLHRCQLSARAVALIYNWWSLFVLLASPECSTRGDHQPTVVDVIRWAANRTCRPNHNCPRRPQSGANLTT